MAGTGAGDLGDDAPRVAPPDDTGSLAPMDAMLRAQKRLFDLQAELAAEQLSDQRAQRAANQKATWTKTMADKLRIVWNGALVLVFASLAIVAVVMVINAARSRNVIIEAFDAPPALAGGGLNGKVVAASILDEFIRVQREVRADVEQSAATTAWSQQIEVQVPRTGLSVSQIDRMLRRLLGNDTEITGELVQLAPGRLALTVRGTGIAAMRFEGTPAELPRIARDAAEYLFGEGEPLLMSIYLNQQGRYEDTERFAVRVLPRMTDPRQRAAMLANLATALKNLGRLEEAIDRQRSAIALNPISWSSRDTLVLLLNDVGRNEDAHRVGRELRQLIEATPEADRPGMIRVQNLLIMENDWLTVDRATREDAAIIAGGTGVGDTALYLVENAIALNDWREASLLLAQLDRRRPITRTLRLAAAGQRFLEQERWPEAVEAFTLLRAHVERFPDAGFTLFPDQLPYALARAGQLREAAQAARDIGSDSYFGLLARAGAYVAPSTIGQADTVYARAVRQVPSRSDGWAAWGRARLVAGDARGAEARFRKATELAPNWANGWKGLGDALVAQGRTAEAVQAYRRASERSPGWLLPRAELQRLAN